MQEQQSAYSTAAAAMESVGKKHQRSEKTEKAEKTEKPERPRVNTSVYVTGLPEDAVEAEVAELFQKCGILMEDDQGIKTYCGGASVYRQTKSQAIPQ